MGLDLWGRVRRVLDRIRPGDDLDIDTREYELALLRREQEAIRRRQEVQRREAEEVARRVARLSWEVKTMGVNDGC
jgi:dihydroxyacid dehydratase/phosphogluconate dehydratase